MRQTKPASPRVYMQAEKVAIVTEIARRYRQEGRALAAIAEDLGISPSNYYKWRNDGISPQPAPVLSIRRPYSAADRERLKGEVERLLGDGKNLQAACQAVGISTKSFRKWCTDAEPAPILRPVELTTTIPSPTCASASTGLSLVSPGGFRIEGLTVETATQLLRALS